MSAGTSALPPALAAGGPRRPRTALSPGAWIGILAVLAAAAIGLYLTVDLGGDLGYVLPRRVNKVLTMVLVAYAVGVSTVLFQTVTGNRILTPSIMGFDALYVLIQTVLVFSLGSVGVVALGDGATFGLELALMVGFSWLVYRWLFTGTGKSLHLVLLVGIVLGTVFRGISSLLQRLLEPSEFVVLQDAMFASFGNVDTGLLRLSALLVGLVSLVALAFRRHLDVLALGRDTAISLGVDHTRVVTAVLVVCSVLVGVCTALVGPITFFGLLVANLAYALCRTFRHRHVLPMAVLLGIIALVGGQVVLEQVFAFDTALSIVIEFAGGLLFLVLLLRGSLK
ncbi:iron chelate uptake ABC transporter family permease subunit [Kocuria sp. CPCC 205268]|uniref:iron chelate uptake ABC transporter family permease subunit n=1 Tax=Kocuria oxytropis TaxID=3058913 RepID=UPI0034D59F6C